MRGWRRWLAVGAAAVSLVAAGCNQADTRATSPAGPSPSARRSPSATPSPATRAAATPAAAGTPAPAADTELPLQTYGSMAVDAGHGHVFVTGGLADPLVVVDYRGAVVAVLGDETGGAAMYLDGSTLYLARPSFGLLDAIDTATLQRSRSFPTAPILAPSSVAVAGGLVWLSNQPSLAPGLESLDPGSGVTVAQPLPGAAAGTLTTAPAGSDRLLVTENDGTPRLDLLDVSKGSARLLGSADIAGGSAGQTLVSRDGTQLWVGDASPAGIATYRTDDLRPAGRDGPALAPAGPQYTTASAAGAVAFLPAVEQLAVGVPHATGSTIEVFPVGDGTARAEVQVPGQLSFDGIRAAPDRPLLFVVHAVVTGNGLTPPHLEVVDLAAAHPALGDDFGMMAFPSPSLTVVQGAAASLTVAVGVASGDYEPVALSTRGLPAGVTASFSPASTLDRSTLTLSVAAGTAPGTTRVSVAGATGSASHAIDVALTVAPSEGLTATASERAVDVVQGQSKQVAVLATGKPAAPGAGEVRWSVAGLPIGVTAAFAPPVTALGAGAELTLTASGPGPGDAVSSPVVVTATSSEGVATLTLDLTVTALPVDFWQLVSAPPPGVAGAPAVTSWGPGRLDLFVEGADGRLWHRFTAPVTGPAWSRWEDLGGSLASAPAAVASAPDRIDVFVRGRDQELWHRWWDGRAWHEWEPLGGTLTSAPSVASWAPGRLDVVATGNGRTVYQRSWQTVWSNWVRVGGTCQGDPALTSPGVGQLDVVCLGDSSRLYHAHARGSWSAWAPDVPGIWGPGVAATSAGTGRFDVFGVDPATQALGHAWWDGFRWRAETLDGALVAAPAAVAGPGTAGTRVDVVGVGPTGQIHRRAVG